MPHRNARPGELSLVFHNMSGNPIVQATHHRSNGFIVGDGFLAGSNQDRFNCLDNNFIIWHFILRFDETQSGIHAVNAFPDISGHIFEFDLFQQKHTAKLISRKIFFQHLINLVQRHTQVFERQQAIEPRELLE